MKRFLGPVAVFVLGIGTAMVGSLDLGDGFSDAALIGLGLWATGLLLLLAVPSLGARHVDRVDVALFAIALLAAVAIGLYVVGTAPSWTFFVFCAGTAVFLGAAAAFVREQRRFRSNGPTV
jgi:hypothetical membrane protein